MSKKGADTEKEYILGRVLWYCIRTASFFCFSCVFVPWKPNSGTLPLILSEKDVGDKSSTNTETVWNFTSSFSRKLRCLKISSYKFSVEAGQATVLVHVREFETRRARVVSLSPKEKKPNIPAKREKLHPFSLSLSLSPFSLSVLFGTLDQLYTELYLHQQFFFIYPF